MDQVQSPHRWRFIEEEKFVVSDEPRGSLSRRRSVYPVRFSYTLRRHCWALKEFTVQLHNSGPDLLGKSPYGFPVEQRRSSLKADNLFDWLGRIMNVDEWTT